MIRFEFVISVHADMVHVCVAGIAVTSASPGHWIKLAIQPELHITACRRPDGKSRFRWRICRRKGFTNRSFITRPFRSDQAIGHCPFVNFNSGAADMCGVNIRTVLFQRAILVIVTKVVGPAAVNIKLEALFRPAFKRDPYLPNIIIGEQHLCCFPIIGRSTKIEVRKIARIILIITTNPDQFISHILVVYANNITAHNLGENIVSGLFQGAISFIITKVQRPVPMYIKFVTLVGLTVEINNCLPHVFANQ